MRRLILVVAVVSLTAACGGGDGGEVSLEDYFIDVEAAAAAYDEAAARVDTALSESTDPVSDVKELFPGFVGDLGGFVEALEAIAAADEVSAEHATTVTRGRAVLAAYEDLVAELDGVDDLIALSNLFEGPKGLALGETGDLFSQSCDALQSIADAEGIEVELQCH